MSAEQWKQVNEFVRKEWDQSVVPLMERYIEIPSQSPNYDTEWATNGLQEKAMALLVDWVKAQTVQGMKMELFEEQGRTPFLYLEIEGTTNTKETVMMYGHMDKQPPLLPWDEGLHPYKPVIRDGRLYGRAGADDGYALCASLLSVIGMQKFGIPHANIRIVIEGCEESGSFDLTYWLDKIGARMGDVSLVVCLDSGALDWDRCWVTTSLRGVVQVTVRVELLKEGVHSGIAGGVVADSFRVLRMLLNRVEDVETGAVKIKEAYCDVPQSCIDNMAALNEVDFVGQFPVLPGVLPEPGDNVKLGLRNFWEPSITVVGMDGMPDLKGGNVLRQQTTAKLSIRIPPFADAEVVGQRFKEVLEANPPYNAQVTVTRGFSASGWGAPPIAPWLAEGLKAGSEEVWGKTFSEVGLGGTIPFMGMLGKTYPKAQFVVTGVLGPNSNAHGPNEFLDIEYGKGVNIVVGRVLHAHYNQVKDL